MTRFYLGFLEYSRLTESKKNTDFLNAGEYSRWRTIRDTAAGRGFLAGRILSKSMLSAQTGEEARIIDFDFSDSGKPRLRGSSSWHFSISHSRNIAACAVSRRCIGLDIQYRRPGRSGSRIIDDVYHPDERGFIRDPELHPDQARRRFYDIWAAKESVLKCHNQGVWLMGNLPSFRFDEQHIESPTLSFFLTGDYSLAVTMKKSINLKGMELTPGFPAPHQLRMQVESARFLGITDQSQWGEGKGKENSPKDNAAEISDGGKRTQ